MDFKRFVDKGSDRIPTIETDIYEPHPENKGMVRHAGMRTYGEVFRELKAHLEEMGMLPDEYFNDSYSLYHKDNEQLLNFDEAICYVNFGGNEGIYLDIFLAGYSDKGPVEVKFATGKTLSTDVEAYYKMSMICAECSLMLNGRGDSIRLGRDNLKIELSRVDRGLEKVKDVDTQCETRTITLKADSVGHLLGQYIEELESQDVPHVEIVNILLDDFSREEIESLGFGEFISDYFQESSVDAVISDAKDRIVEGTPGVAGKDDIAKD